MIKSIDPIGSLMNFNVRVLHTARQHLEADVKSLRKSIFFSSVYQSNCDELFAKESHATPTLVAKFKGNGPLYNSVVRDVLVNMRELDLYLLQEMDMGIYPILFPMIKDVKPMSNPIFHTGWLYYITLHDGAVRIRGINPIDAVYQRPLELDGLFYKTDKAILNFFRLMDDSEYGVVFRVTGEENTPSMIHKVEYYGDSDLLEGLISKYFRHTELVMVNPFLYLGDIQQVLETAITPEREIIEPSSMAIEEILVKDRLVEYPRQSFNNFLNLLQQAAGNSMVDCIDITLYRIGSSPALLNVLARAVANGINVNVHLELHARGEEINRLWMKLFQFLHINVYQYFPGQIKVHAKLTLITFKNGDMIAQIGTGNYHTKTALQYTDLMLFTSDEEICYEIMKLFNVLRAQSIESFYEDRLLVSRYNARSALLTLIDQEAEKGENGSIIMKMNALDDPEIIERLSLAEDAGCHICLIVRGLCTWLPNNLGDNMEIRSMIWDKLEHSRVYCFGAVNPTIYLGSMDLVQRKMDHRIETLCRVDDPDIVLQLTDYLNRYTTETKNVWLMQPDGSYRLKEK